MHNTGPMTRRLTATPYVFLVPALALLGIFVVYPIVAVVFYSFTDYDIVRPPVWIGLDNYAKLLADDTFWLALTHSFVYLLVTPILIGLSIVLAIVVKRQLRGIHIYRALYFVPAVSGSIAIGLSWRWLFERSGFINGMLQSMGVIDKPIQWLATRIAAQPPDSVRHTKRLLLATRSEQIAAARKREDQGFVERVGTPENLEAVMAFFEKRPPDFKKLRG